jgi:hypothetical protein
VSEILYLVSFGAQEDEIEEYCFRRCGKIIVNAVLFVSGGAFGVCLCGSCEFTVDTYDAGEAELESGEIKHLIFRKLRRCQHEDA